MEKPPFPQRQRFLPPSWARKYLESDRLAPLADGYEAATTLVLAKTIHESVDHLRRHIEVTTERMEATATEFQATIKEASAAGGRQAKALNKLTAALVFVGLLQIVVLLVKG